MLASSSNVSYVSASSIFLVTVLSRQKTMKPVPSGTGLPDFMYLFKDHCHTKTNQTTKITENPKTKPLLLHKTIFLTPKKSYANHL